MDFFKKIKNKLTTRPIAIFGFMVLAGLFFVAGGIATMFDKTEDQGVRIMGITMPAALAGLLEIVIGVVCLILFTWVVIKEIKEDEAYSRLMKQVEKAGDADKIGTVLASLPKNKKVAKGELRFNEEYLFYMKGTDAFFLSKDDIKRIDTRTEIDEEDLIEKFYICIKTSGDLISAGNDIQVSKINMPLLFRELSDTYGLNQY